VHHDWSDVAFERDHIEGSLEALRHLGVPQSLFPFVRALWALGRRLRRWASGLTRA
jgi:hypothetical protein